MGKLSLILGIMLLLSSVCFIGLTILSVSILSVSISGILISCSLAFSAGWSLSVTYGACE